MIPSASSRYDFGRGPNSILFGNGTLSGTSSAKLKNENAKISILTGSP